MRRFAYLDGWRRSMRRGGSRDYRPAGSVAELARRDHDEVNQCPYAESPEREDHRHGRAVLPGIEPMRSEPAEKEAQDQRSHELPVTRFGGICRTLLGARGSACIRRRHASLVGAL